VRAVLGDPATRQYHDLVQLVQALQVVVISSTLFGRP
jgi:hypothetical protein